MLDAFDPETIADPDLRRLFLWLLNRQEEQLAEIARLRQELLQVQAENRRLQGQSPRPKFPGAGGARPGGKGTAPADHSSETERGSEPAPPPRKKAPKLDRITLDRTVTLPFPPDLPPDAVFKGYEEVVVQDLVLRTDNIRFRKAKFYSPGTGQTYLAAVPPGYAGGYGPGVKSLALALAYDGQMSFPAVQRFFLQAGTLLSRGQISRFLTERQEAFHAEAAAVREAGLRSVPWANYDVTSTRVDGQNYACHVFGNPLFTGFSTAPQQDRATVVEVLQGGVRTHRVDALALAQLAEGGLAARTLRQLARLPAAVTFDALEFAALLDQRLPRLSAATRHRIATATAVAAYRAETGRPVLACLVSDDAAALQGVTPEQMLCWVHDGRHYQKLQPEHACFQKAVAAFRTRYWAFYRELLAYRTAPSAAEALRLTAAFDTLFAHQATYVGLATCIARTRGNQEKLLLVLRHPELPLHNNEAELAARRRVRRRDVSFGPRSAAGMRAWDTFQSLAATTAKLGISFYAYLQDRLGAGGGIPPLADLITARAASLSLGASWEPG